MSQLDIFKPVENPQEVEVFRFPLELHIAYRLHGEFRSMVEKEPSCIIINVIEMKVCKVLCYLVDCPKDKEDYITELAFMTWIKNPKFQKYYLDTKAFGEISNEYYTSKGFDNESNTNVPDLEEISRSDADPGL